MRFASFSLLALVLAGTACGDDTTVDGSGGGAPGSGGSDGSGGDASSPAATTTTGATGTTTTSTTSASSSSGGEGGAGVGSGGGTSVDCSQLPAADRDRFVVVGRPAVPDYQVLVLSESGELSATEHTFTMGEANDVPIAFTPDGRIGIAVQDDGSLGVFTLAADGTPTVIDPAFQPGGNMEFYASDVIMSPEGDHVITVSQNWPEDGGGLYRVDLDCATGTLTLVGKQIESKNAWSVLSLGVGRWAIAGKGAGGVEDGTEVHDIREGDPWTRAGGAEAFPHEDAIMDGFAAARDGSFLLVGDTASFIPEPNVVSFVGVDATGFEAKGTPVEVEDPYAILVGPSSRVALIASGFGDALLVADVDPTAEEPISIRGEVDYVTNPQLPGKMTMVRRGDLDGLVLGSDVGGVRIVRFVDDDVVDEGVFTDSGSNVIGIGIQP
jgi:hypothetical protein